MSATSEKIMKTAKAKELMTVNIIQQNKQMKKLTDEMKKTMDFLIANEQKFATQKELYARIKMTERVIASGLNLLEKNKLQFYMINDNTLEIQE